MDITTDERPQRIGSVKAAISIYGGDKIHHTRKPKNSSISVQSQIQTEERTTVEYKQDSKHVMQDLAVAKQELSQLKTDMASALQAKSRAEKDILASSSRLKSYENIIAELLKEIEEADEETVLAELARIEAEREAREMEAERSSGAIRFAKNMDIARERIHQLRQEIERSKELELKLADTNSDIDALNKQMESMRAIVRYGDTDEDELQAAKQELESIKRKGYQFMASMDLIRVEMIQIAGDNDSLIKLEKSAKATINNLQSKLIKAKSKLQTATLADERAKSVVSNLSIALQRLQTEANAAKKERQMISDQAGALKCETEKANHDMKTAEEALQAAMEELKAAKESEAEAMKKLGQASHWASKGRSSATLHGSTITICKNEHDYLRMRAAAALLVSDKKVAAAQAWVEALRAEEKEALMKCELMGKEIRDDRAVEEQVVEKMERSVAAARTIEEMFGYPGTSEGAGASKLVAASPARRSMREVRRAKMRRLSSNSQAMTMMRHIAGSPSFMVRKKTAMPGLVTFLRNRRSSKQ